MNNSVGPSAPDEVAQPSPLGNVTFVRAVHHGGVNVVEIHPLLPDAVDMALIADAVRSYGPASSRELSNITGARRVTVAASLAELRRRGIVRCVGDRWSISPHPSLGWPERTA